VLLLLVAALVWFLHHCTVDENAKSREKNLEKTAAQPETQRPGKKSSDLRPSKTSPLSAKIERKLEATLAQIKKNSSESRQDAEATKRILKHTSQYLLGLPPREAASAIPRQLGSDEDATTGMRFQTGEDGLAAWPTWRVYLPDVLGSINPKLAAAYSRENMFLRYGIGRRVGRSHAQRIGLGTAGAAGRSAA
jgi:hypothetical protein